MKRNETTGSETIQGALGAILADRGYRSLKPQGLVSRAFPDTFAPSVFHDIISKAVSGSQPASDFDKWAGLDWAYRHVDQDKAGFSPVHLSSFRMLAYFSVAQRGEDISHSRAQIYETLSTLLDSHGIQISECLITYFGGGIVGGQQLPADELAPTVWESQGVPSENLVPVEGETCFTNVRRTGEPAGPRCEVYSATPSGRFVEIATTVTEEFMLGASMNTLVPSKMIVCGAALGIERVETVGGDHESVFDLPELRDLTRLVEQRISNNLARLGYDAIRQAVDALRSLAIIAATTTPPYHGSQVRRLEKLGRIAHRSLRSIGVVNITYNDIIIHIVNSIINVHFRETADSRVVYDTVAIYTNI